MYKKIYIILEFVENVALKRLGETSYINVLNKKRQEPRFLTKCS